MNHDEDLEEIYEGALPDAIIFASNAHSGQYRKLSPKPYIIHPLRVSEFILKNFAHRQDLETLRVIAVLHDTIEDTWVDEERIREEFGEIIAKCVVELSEPDNGTKQERHEKYVKILEDASDEAKIVKLSDIFDNVIYTDDNEKWKTFLLKSKKTLGVLNLMKQDAQFEKIKKDLHKIIDNKLMNYDN
ncbi:MAG: HD domain-containing protein [Candidatus Nanoarchaeia archaeon]